MTYPDLTTVAEVQKFYSGLIFSTQTKPSLLTVQSWIAEATSEVYAVLAQEYVVPVTDSIDLALLKPVAESYVRECIDFVLGYNTYTVSKGGTVIPRSLTHKEFYARLQRFLNGNESLVNTSRSATLRSTSYASENGVTFVASKDETQW